ncbi:hypothetical protein DNI29_08545 [Hymenobacter sediminis]|uniref:TonB-dependent receptor plug domain-containing protein n=1 Tax=Hymenobacter sediminis TaxID=2218621 RepID=UPI000DA6A4A9|nr:TonB-dependent receptor plug domain-containing protein [Hymenobacter sediminis]RPD48653.1 hypothetical protein DNI29_08545 [Hymenobacter sediminis]
MEAVLASTSKTRVLLFRYSTVFYFSKSLHMSFPIGFSITVGLLLLLTQTAYAQLPDSFQATNPQSPDSPRKVIRIICSSSLPAVIEPLYIADGVPVAREWVEASNPNRIKRVDFLKGAQATAIYGTRGVNGVIIITNKRRFRITQLH